MEPDLFMKVSESIKSVFDLTSRIDERVKVIISRQEEQDKKISQVIDHVNNLTSRVVIIESKDTATLRLDVEGTKVRVGEIDHKVAMLEYQQQGAETKWKGLVSFGLELLLGLTSALLIWKLGISPSP